MGDQGQTVQRCLFIESHVKSQGSFTVFAEAFRPVYNVIKAMLNSVCEAVSRPALMHEYRLTPFSLGTAVSNGVSAERVLAFLETHSYGLHGDAMCDEELSSSLRSFVEGCMSRYNLARVVIESDRTLLLCKSEAIAEQLQSDPVIRSLLVSTNVAFGLFSWDGHEARYPYLAAKSRAVTKVLCERCVLMGYPLWQQYNYDCDPLLRTTSCSLHTQTRPRAYQVEAVESATKDGLLNSGCLLLPCGAGKTLVGIMILCKVKKPTLIVCAGSVSVDQWKNQILEYASLESPMHETSGRPNARRSAQIACVTGKQKDDITDDTDIVLTTYSMLVSAFKSESRRISMLSDKSAAPNARKRRSDPKAQLFSSYGLLILDEVHMIPADAFRESLSFVDAKGTIGLTATCVREDKKILDLFHLVGPKLYDISMESLAKEGYLASVQCIEIHTPMTREFGVEYMEQYMNSGSSMKRMPILVLLAAANPLKMECVQDLVARHVEKGDKILVFCDHILILNEYGELLKAPVVCGSTEIKDRLMIFSDFQTTTKVNVICISRVGDVSVNLPSANVVIQVSSHGGSRRQEAQRLGRILRPKEKVQHSQSGPQAWFYSIVSSDTLEMHYAAHRTAFLVDQGYSTRLMKYVPQVQEEKNSVVKPVPVGDQQSIKLEELAQSLQSSRLFSRVPREGRVEKQNTLAYQVKLLSKVVSKGELEFQEYQRTHNIAGGAAAEYGEQSDDDVEVVQPVRSVAALKRELTHQAGRSNDTRNMVPLESLVGVDDACVYHEL